MKYLEAIGIEKNFGGVKALVDGEVTLYKGKILGLLGANGSGKSTLSKIISGIHIPSGGTLKFEGEEIKIKNPQEAEKLGIVMVHQHLSLIPELSVWQNIVLGRESIGKGLFLEDKSNLTRAREALEQLTTEVNLFEQVKNLSPANKQLVEIAKALSRNPKLLILDEPTAALELAQVKKLFELLKEFKTKGVSMVFISHRMWEVTRLCDHVSIFRNGETVSHIDFESEGIDETKIISMITGKAARGVVQQRDNPEINTNETILLTNNLSVGEKVRGVNLDVKKGEIVGIAGLQGQGQEELLMLLSGFMKKSNGDVFVEGKKLKMKSPKEAIGQRMVLVPGDRHEEGAFLTHRVRDNIIYPGFTKTNKSFFIKRKKNDQLVKNVIDKMNVYPPNPSMLLSNLSGGNQQKVVVGKWLQLEPKVLLLSDPAKGVDVNAKEEMYKVIRDLANCGTGVIIYASDNEELINLCHRILVMFEGQVVADLPVKGLTDEDLVEASLGMQKQNAKVEVLS